MLLVISSPYYGKLLIALPAGIPSHKMLNHVLRRLDPTEFRALPDPKDKASWYLLAEVPPQSLSVSKCAAPRPAPNIGSTHHFTLES